MTMLLTFLHAGLWAVALLSGVAAALGTLALAMGVKFPERPNETPFDKTEFQISACWTVCIGCSVALYLT